MILLIYIFSETATVAIIGKFLLAAIQAAACFSSSPRYAHLPMISPVNP